MKGAHEKEAMGYENLKMQTIGRCERRTVLHGPAQYTVAYRSVYRVYIGNFEATYPQVPCLHQCKVHIKGSYRYGELKNVIALSVQ